MCSHKYSFNKLEEEKKSSMVGNLECKNLNNKIELELPAWKHSFNLITSIYPTGKSMAQTFLVIFDPYTSSVSQASQIQHVQIEIHYFAYNCLHLEMTTSCTLPYSEGS